VTTSSVAPGENSNVFIADGGGSPLVVSGPSVPAIINSLVVGGGTDDVTLNLNGGDLIVQQTAMAANLGTIRVGGGVTLQAGGGVTVQPGGTLAGNGTVGGNATIGGNLRPGASVGTLSVTGDVTMAASATFECELGDDGGGNLTADQLALTGAGTVDLTAGPALNLVVPTTPVGDGFGSTLPVGPHSVDIVTTVGGTVTGTFTGVPPAGHYQHGLFMGTYDPGPPAVYSGGVDYSDSSKVSLNAFQALAGDTDGNRYVNFGDFLVLASNYDASGAPSGKDWAAGDFDADLGVDFGDFLVLASNYDETTPYDGESGGGADGGVGGGDGTRLEVNLLDGGSVWLITDEQTLGISVKSPAGSILPTMSGAPYMFILPGANEHLIQHGSLGMPVPPGRYELGWQVDPSMPMDLEFAYGLTDATQVVGSVEYIVPEPGSMVLLVFGVLALAWYGRRRRAA